ncbi:hypothetical protein NDA13_001295 [Ustilago tritici]|nr:hypothetical protein NDA13_001295 [Ustilago tritici]
MDRTPLGEPPWSSAHRPFAYLPQPGRSNRPSFLDEPTSLVEPTSQRGPKPPMQHLQADATCCDLRISFYARRNHQELPPLPQSQPHQQAMQHEMRSSQPFRCLSCHLGLEHHPSQQCEWSLLCLFPWVSSEIADTISLDHLAIVNLIKLHNPTSSTVSKETPTTLTVQGIQINIASTSSTGPLKAFLKAFLDITTFCQVWVVYVSLRAAASSNPALGPVLNHFLVHIINLDRNYPWVNITEYVLTICQKWFGHVDAPAWAVHDTEAFQTASALHLLSSPALPSSSLRVVKLSAVACLKPKIYGKG